jgi:hypothetical protein
VVLYDERDRRDRSYLVLEWGEFERDCEGERGREAEQQKEESRRTERGECCIEGMIGRTMATGLAVVFLFSRSRIWSSEREIRLIG